MRGRRNACCPISGCLALLVLSGCGGGSSDENRRAAATAAPSASRTLPQVFPGSNDTNDTKSLPISDATVRSDDGAIFRRIVFDRDAAGDAAGPDGTLLTGDDLIVQYTEYRRDPDEGIVMWADFDGPGADGAWFTADDELSLSPYYAARENADGKVLEQCQFQKRTDDAFSQAGPDGQWFTFDDVPFSCARWVSSDRYMTLSPGDDGVWNTADDTAESFVQFQYDEQGRITSKLDFGVGPDGQPGTNDDVRRDPATRYRYPESGGRTVDVVYAGDDSVSESESRSGSRQIDQFDADGNARMTAVFDSAGADGQWGTADDVIDWAWRWEYATSAEVAIPPAIYTAARGFDDFFGFASEEADPTVPVAKRLLAEDAALPGDEILPESVQSYDAYHYPDAQTIEKVSYGLGPDGVAFTEDDDIRGYVVVSLGVIVEDDVGAIYYNAPGGDGVWRTADDEIERYSLWRVSPRPNGIEATERYYIEAPGPDRMWFTQDDAGGVIIKLSGATPP